MDVMQHSKTISHRQHFSAGFNSSKKDFGSDWSSSLCATFKKNTPKFYWFFVDFFFKNILKFSKNIQRNLYSNTVHFIEITRVFQNDHRIGGSSLQIALTLLWKTFRKNTAQSSCYIHAKLSYIPEHLKIKTNRRFWIIKDF